MDYCKICTLDFAECTCKEREAEQQRLDEAVDCFAAKMKAKLRLKASNACGSFRGWDDKEFVESGRCQDAMMVHVSRLMRGQPEAVDVANFCMFIDHAEDSQ